MNARGLFLSLAVVCLSTLCLNAEKHKLDISESGYAQDQKFSTCFYDDVTKQVSCHFKPGIRQIAVQTFTKVKKFCKEVAPFEGYGPLGSYTEHTSSSVLGPTKPGAKGSTCWIYIKE